MWITRALVGNPGGEGVQGRDTKDGETGGRVTRAGDPWQVVSVQGDPGWGVPEHGCPGESRLGRGPRAGRPRI